MTHDVALFHRRNEAVIEMKVRSANASARNFHDRVAWIQNSGIGDVLDSHVLYTHIANGFHAILLLATKTSLRSDPERIGCVGSAILSTPVTTSRGPCG